MKIHYAKKKLPQSKKSSIKFQVEFIHEKFSKKREEVRVILIKDRTIIGHALLSTVTSNRVRAPKREIIKMALNGNIDSITVVHNHPGASAIPSIGDIFTAKDNKALTDGLNIKLHEFIVGEKNDHHDVDFFDMTKILSEIDFFEYFFCEAALYIGLNKGLELVITEAIKESKYDSF